MAYLIPVGKMVVLTVRLKEPSSRKSKSGAVMSLKLTWATGHGSIVATAWALDDVRRPDAKRPTESSVSAEFRFKVRL